MSSQAICMEMYLQILFAYDRKLLLSRQLIGNFEASFLAASFLSASFNCLCILLAKPLFSLIVDLPDSATFCLMLETVIWLGRALATAGWSQFNAIVGEVTNLFDNKSYRREWIKHRREINPFKLHWHYETTKIVYKSSICIRNICRQSALLSAQTIHHLSKRSLEQWRATNSLLTLNMVDIKNSGNSNSANPHKIICVLSSGSADRSLRHCIR